MRSARAGLRKEKAPRENGRGAKARNAKGDKRSVRGDHLRRPLGIDSGSTRDALAFALALRNALRFEFDQALLVIWDAPEFDPVMDGGL